MVLGLQKIQKMKQEAREGRYAKKRKNISSK